MINWNSKLGQRAAQRLDTEFVIWLTTVGQTGLAHPRPVWFIWDGEALLIYSQPNTKKLEHIAHNPNVVVHFDGGPKGLDVQVFAGTAEIVPNPTPADRVSTYVQKYGQEIRNLGATAEEFAQGYSVAIRVKPNHLRGMIPG